MNSNNKRKNRTNTNNKPSRPKGPQDRNIPFEGVYGNARFMHTAASLVGCIVHVQVKNGAVYEGIFRTFSQEFDLVLEVVHELDKARNNAPPNESVGSLISSLPPQETVAEKMIFNLDEVVLVTASNVDTDYATRDSFTDTAISKFNGQVVERELTPWEDPSSEDTQTKLEPDEDTLNSSLAVLDNAESKNGWDANEMFRTNAEKYGVTSSYDSSLHGYTVPLEPKNTEEYKQREAKAQKLAQEIENSSQYRARIALENGDEEERYSAVIRPNDNNSGGTRYVPPARRKNTQGERDKMPRNTSQISSFHPKYPHSQQPISSSSSSSSQGHNKPFSSGVSNASYTPPSTTQQAVSGGKSPLSHPPAGLQQNMRPASPRQPLTHPHHPIGDHKMNGPNNNAPAPLLKDKEEEYSKPPDTSILEDKEPLHHPPPPETSSNSGTNAVPLPPRVNEKKREQSDKKNTSAKGRDESIAELKKFSTDFKLPDDHKDNKEHKEDGSKPHPPPPPPPPQEQQLVSNHREAPKTKEPENERDKVEESSNAEENKKKSTLNPNAKEFVFNPNAKTFTPRSPLTVSTPPGPNQGQPHRVHSTSPVVQLPQHQMVPGMGQPILTTLAPQYVVSAAPVSMSLAPPFAPAGSVNQGPRFRKGNYSFAAVPMTMQPRHDISPSMHVAAATGQPILAPASMQSPPQLTVQYAPPQGMMPGPGPHQPTMGYPQMYSVVRPSVMSPQPMGMIPTTHTISYADSPHIPAQLYMTQHQGGAGMPPGHHAVPVSVQSMVQQGNTGHHSNPPTPQSQTPATSLHATPSPVHQAPPGPTQPPTPTGHPGPTQTPQPVVYHGQPPHQAHTPNPPNSQTPHLSHNHPPPHPPPTFGGPQPVVLMPQQAVPNPHGPHPPSGPPLQGHPLHGHAAGSHAGTPTHVLPHTPITVIPTSATMVPSPGNMANSQFVPHQGHKGLLYIL